MFAIFYYRTCPGMKSRYGEVFKQYEQDRRTVILPLGNVCMVALSYIHIFLGNLLITMTIFKNNIFLMQPLFIAYSFDIGHPCYGQFIPVKTNFLLSSILLPAQV